jgi:hypothetical protein
MRRLLRTLAFLGLPASLAGAQDVDMMAKWSAVAVVRYVVVGEFAGEPTIMWGANGFSRKGRVTDRIEVTFDWNQNEMALVGTPTVKNFPSSVVETAVPGCPAARINGTYEHLDGVAAKQFSSVLELAATRRYPAGAIPYAGEGACGEAWDTAADSLETVDMMLLVLPTVYFGMPAAGGANLSISKDGKSMILVDEPNGWTWTYTPTPVQ